MAQPHVPLPLPKKQLAAGVLLFDSEYRFVILTDALQLLTQRGANRVQHALAAVKTKQTVYLENGVVILP